MSAARSGRESLKDLRESWNVCKDTHLKTVHRTQTGVGFWSPWVTLSPCPSLVLAEGGFALGLLSDDTNVEGDFIQTSL